jgi:hypothetical protein
MRYGSTTLRQSESRRLIKLVSKLIELFQISTVYDRNRVQLKAAKPDGLMYARLLDMTTRLAPYVSDAELRTLAMKRSAEHSQRSGSALPTPSSIDAPLDAHREHGATALRLYRVATQLSHTKQRSDDQHLQTLFRRSLSSPHPLVRLRARHSFQTFARTSTANDQLSSLIPMQFVNEVCHNRYC